jgi:hypothetical protein
MIRSIRSPTVIFEEISRYVQWSNQMRNVSHQVSGLVRKGKEIANGLLNWFALLLGQSRRMSRMLGQI